MTKTKCAIAIACAMLLAVAVSTAGEEVAWLDLEGCDICSKMSAEEGLMQDMQWENHLISNGMLSVATVSPQYAEAFDRAGKAMEKMGAKMASGEKLHLCGFCSSMGSLMMQGAQHETIRTATGSVSLITSGDPEVVAAIRKHGQHTIDEFAKMTMAEHAGQAQAHNN